MVSHAAAFAGGSGTIADPYQIEDITDLQNMRNALSSHYILINDIDASITSTWNSGAGFIPVGTAGEKFTGTFNGNHHIITDIYIYRPTTDNVALFGYTESATIQNVALINVTVTGRNHVGALVGNAGTGTSIAVSGSGAPHALFGNNATITGAGDGDIGGLVGTNAGTIDSCYSTCDVSGVYAVGGLVGYNAGTVNECYAAGDVDGEAGYTGGLIGYNTGTVTASYYDGGTTGQTDTGKGTKITTAQMQTQSTFTGWDFTNTWRMFLYNYNGTIYTQYPALLSTYGDAFYLYPGNITIDRQAPPLLHSVTLDMFRAGAHYYDILIATDETYTGTAYTANTLSPGIMANLTRDLTLDARTYFMRVQAKDSTGATFDTAYSTFTITQTLDLGTTAVAGAVYEIQSGVNIPVNNARIFIYNNTWSNSYVTGSNGYYQFVGLASNETYFMTAAKNGYVDSTINIFTPGLNETVTKNIMLQKESAPTYIMPHYVRFTVRSLLGGVYEGVTVSVFEGDSATPLFTQVTGDDGAVGFELSENIRYRLTLVSEADNINTVYRVTPTKNEYNIYVSLTGSSHQGDAGLILYGMHIDGNELNVTWQDTSGLTSLVEVTIKNRDDSIAYYLNSTDSDGFLLQDVNTTENLTYIVELKVHSGGLDETFIRTHILTFESGVRPAFDLGFSASWQPAFLASLSLIFLAVIFGSGNAHVGAILVSLGGLFHIFVTGWIPASVLTVAMTFIAVIMSVFFYMRKSESIR